MEKNEQRHQYVANVEDVDAMNVSKGTRFGAKIKSLSRATYPEGLACNWFEVEPGKTAFPHHYHSTIYEAIFILRGTGTCRLGDDEFEVRVGDYIQFPLGPEFPHQLLNSGDEPLQYLCFSNAVTTDVVGYPDSGKVGAMSAKTTDFFADHWHREVFFTSDSVGYYDGEQTGGEE